RRAGAGIPGAMTLTTIARGDGSLIAEPHRTIVGDADSWRALWAAHAGPAVAAPEVDFRNLIVAAAFAGERPSAGYRVEIVPGAADSLVEVIEHRPDPGMASAQIIVTPYHIVSMPRGEGDVRFAE